MENDKPTGSEAIETNDAGPIEVERTPGDEAGDPIKRQAAEQADRIRAAREELGPQRIQIRANPRMNDLGVVVQRYGGGYECEKLTPRHTREIELNAGDSVTVVPLAGPDLDTFLRMTGCEPKADEEQGGTE